jgi:hypothetical protein
MYADGIRALFKKMPFLKKGQNINKSKILNSLLRGIIDCLCKRCLTVYKLFIGMEFSLIV